MWAEISGSLSASVAEEGAGEGEFVLMGEGRGHRHLDAADADADQGTDVQQPQAIVSQVAWANWVWARPSRRSAQMST